MSKGKKKIQSKDHDVKRTKERKRIVTSKISKVANGFKRQKVEDKDIDSVFQTYISKTDDIIW